MSNLLHRLCTRIEHSEPAIYYADEIAEWPDEEQKWCFNEGVLAPAGAARELVCTNCADQSWEEVVYVQDHSTGSTTAYLPCATCGPVRIPLARLTLWRVDLQRLTELSLRELPLSYAWHEAKPSRRLWQVGSLQWEGTKWSVLFCRRCGSAGNRREVEDLIPRRSVVVSPCHTLNLSSTKCVCVSLANLATWQSSGVVIDEAYLNEQFADRCTRPSEEPRRKAGVRRRSSRATAIELLTRQLKEHVQSAADHAQATADRQGLAELLPRPSQRELAKELGISEVAVSRCMKDPAARELRLLWETAADLDRLLSLRFRHS